MPQDDISLKMATIDKTLWCHILGDHCLNTHCHEYLISDTFTKYVWWMVYGNKFALLSFRQKIHCHWQTLGTQIQMGPKEEAVYNFTRFYVFTSVCSGL
jgi:hypothetical protein